MDAKDRPIGMISIEERLADLEQRVAALEEKQSAGEPPVVAPALPFEEEQQKADDQQS